MTTTGSKRGRTKTKRSRAHPPTPPASPPFVDIGDVDIDAVRRVHTYLPALRRYFRYEARHLSRIPREPSLLVANHSGGKLPIDMFLFGGAWYDHFHYQRPLRSLIHDILFKPSPWVDKSFRRLGCVPAKPSHADAIFARGEAALVLPGGDYETFRPYSERNKIDFGRRTGFVRTALRARVPITPVVTIGSHELFFVLSRGERAAKLLRLDKIFRYNAFPLIVGAPFGLYVGPLPSPFPLPSKIVTEVLRPIHLHEEEDDHRAYSARDLDSVHAALEMQQVVTGRMQQAMDRLAAERRLPIIG